MTQAKLPGLDQLDFVDDGAAAVLLNTPTRARILLWSCFAFFVVAIIWAAWAQLDEVTSGQGKVIPSRQLQVGQNLEGGIIKEIFVREGEVVHPGQELMRIDDTRFRSDFREREQELVSLKGDVARLRAALASVIATNNPKQSWREQITIQQTPIQFPEGYVQIFPENAKRLENAQQGA